jgi:Icc-related predicted phosphoesterase
MTREVRIAAVGDLHCRKSSAGLIHPAVAPANDLSDVLILCGDLTDHGLADEAHVLARELAGLRVPIVAVLGNHDFESGHPEEVTRILTKAGVQVLDGDAIELFGVGIAGVKGFLGGFGRGTLGPWGEPGVKRFVQEVLDEALKLEAALQRLRNEKKIAVLHYSPVVGTVVGEPVEIYPYLGCSRLEEPLTRYPVDLVFHGHAHHGAPAATTKNGIRVFNAAMPLMRSLAPDKPPLTLVTL